MPPKVLTMFMISELEPKFTAINHLTSTTKTGGSSVNSDQILGLVSKLADNGSAIVIINAQCYIDGGKPKLSNTNFYELLNDLMRGNPCIVIQCTTRKTLHHTQPNFICDPNPII